MSQDQPAAQPTVDLCKSDATNALLIGVDESVDTTAYQSIQSGDRNPRGRPLVQSPARAYISVRKLLEKVEHLQGRDERADASSDLSPDFLNSQNLSDWVVDLATHKGDASSAQANPEEEYSPLPPSTSADQAKKTHAAVRAARRIHWLAQWTQNVLEAYPFVDDSDTATGRSEASPARSPSRTLRALLKNESKSLLLTGNNNTKKILLNESSSNRDGSRDNRMWRVGDEGKPATAEVRCLERVIDKAADALTATTNSEVNIQEDTSASSESGMAETAFGRADRNDKTTAATETVSAALDTEPHDQEAAEIHSSSRRDSVADSLILAASATASPHAQFETRSPPVERRLSYVSEHGLQKSASTSKEREALKDMGHSETRISAESVQCFTPFPNSDGISGNPTKTHQRPSVNTRHDTDAERQRKGRGGVRLAATAAPAFHNISFPTPPSPSLITPPDRAPLCRDVGEAHDVPMTVADQRAALQAQNCCCAHCGAAIALPSLGFAGWWSFGWRAVCRAVSRGRLCRLCCCFGCEGDPNDESGDAEDERVNGFSTPRSASRVLRGGSRITSENNGNSYDNRNNHSRQEFFARGGTITRHVSNPAYDDDALLGSNEVNERRGLLEHNHHPTSTSSFSVRNTQRDVHQTGQRTRWPPPQQITARRLRPNSSLTNAISTPAAAGAAVARTVGSNLPTSTIAPLSSPDSLLTTTSAIAVPGALYCVSEGVYLCPDCFDARSDASVSATLLHCGERFVEADAWQVRDSELQHDDNSSSADYGNSDVSPVRAVVIRAADRLNRWWMSRHLAENAASSSYPPFLKQEASVFSLSARVHESSQQHTAAVPRRCMIPAHVLQRWDFTRYPVSLRAASLLQELNAGHIIKSSGDDTGNRSERAGAAAPLDRACIPMLYDISIINPALYCKVPALAAASQLRKRMCLLHTEAWWCPRYRSEVWGVNRGRREAIKPNDNRFGEGGETTSRMKPTNTTTTEGTDALGPLSTQPPTTGTTTPAVAENLSVPAANVSASPLREENNKKGERENEGESRDPQGGDNDSSDETEKERWLSPSLPPPRCPPKRRYLVERAEGWSMLDLYRLTISQATTAHSATSSRLSERPTTISANDINNNSNSECQTLAEDTPLLFAELQSIYGVLRDHLSHCEYCRMHCRGVTERE